MKKIFTLLFTVGLFTLAQAQPGTRDNRQTDRRDDQRMDQRDQHNGYDNQRDIAYERNNPYDNNNRYNNGMMSPNRKRDIAIAKVNREYDHRIMKVRNSYFSSRWEKQRQMRFLEEQRQREIRKVYFKFQKHGNRYDDRDNRRY